MAARLVEIERPAFEPVPPPAPVPAEVYRSHLAALRAAAAARGLTHVLVYGDREHVGNLLWATGFDARFEEALLVIGPHDAPLVLAGNECLPYVAVSPLHATGELHTELYQPFSLPSQPRAESRRLSDILRDEGIGAGSRVGIVGWKFLTAVEHDDPLHAVDVPAHLADTVRALAGWEAVVNATDLLIHPGYGLRAIAGPDEIAQWEYANAEASRATWAVIDGLSTAVAKGWTDLDVVREARLAGLPLGCHPTFATAGMRHLGLSGPTGQPIVVGQPLGFNISHWGSNICRAGWIAAGPQELPASAQDYVDAFVGPYIAALSAWLSCMVPGTRGGDVFDLVHRLLPDDVYGITLNPGHLIAYEEWVSSPIAEGSDDVLRSGMVLQIDVIPSHPDYFSTRMEEGIVIADDALCAELAERHPDVLRRCIARRTFMRETLGYDVPDTVLPLADIAGMVTPFFLSPGLAIALR
jgi:Xaa-Pro aminopeptidase